jgi:SAM-dependent methyltransferase
VNDLQIEYWNSAAGTTWAAMQARLDAQLAPLGRAALDELAPVPGERVIDIGCGAGATTIELSARVAPTGEAIGVDISRPLLAAARARAPSIRFLEGDAQIHDFSALGACDAVYSRFGVMFFDDPTAAFTNLARALRPGGRVAFVCWRAPEENPIMTVPLRAAVAAGLPPPAPPDDLRAPGPFAFADRAYVAGILERAGFASIVHTAHDERVGGNDLDAALELALEIGPLGRMLREHAQHRAGVIDAVRAALAGYAVGGHILMPSATWIVTAIRRP